MESVHSTEDLVCCPTCGLVQRVGPVPSGGEAICARCEFEVLRDPRGSLACTAACALAAAFLYVPANVYPLITTTYWGAKAETTIFDAVDGLISHGEIAIGLLLFFTSILTPALKILGLLILVATIRFHRGRVLRTWVYKLILWIDPWNMLEVFLLALVVAIAELGRVASVDPGPGAFSFAMVVVLTIVASLSFDPRLLWDDDPVPR